MELSIEERERGEWLIVAVAGEIDLLTAPALRERLISAIDGGADRLVLDLSAVGFIDSSGLGTLIAAHKRLREREGEFIIVATARAILSVLTLTGLDKVFTVVADVERAVGARSR